jgi:hypothetical protein
MRLVFGGDPQRGHALGGWMKPVHAELAHGILVLPLLAWLMAGTARKVPLREQESTEREAEQCYGAPNR